MDGMSQVSAQVSDRLISRAALALTGHKRRRLVAEVALELCEGNARRSEERFGWSRRTAEKGMREKASGCLRLVVPRPPFRLQPRISVELHPRQILALHGVGPCEVLPSRAAMGA